ncbi:uncharacterized protein LOC117556908 [Gymnodraco acuticeps]|uniref:Uncharacterized protein LOC117556908 n=1 Tax=Gymnodraco acuticeps TaxID=8218 RepID=A0A6P8VDS7_GYMAC|nr:uncharacterized protein LOC117556908 [Gymnodraco acuticeps]
MIAAAVSVKADEETGRSGSVDAVRREKERAIVEEHKAQEQRIKRKQEKERKDRERETQKRIDKEMADALSPLHTRKNKGETKLYPVEELREAEQSFDGTAYQGDAYPLVQVANPHYGVDGDLERMLRVFRPWTMDECKKACEGLTPYKQDPAQFVLDHTALIASYGLNGHEVLRTLMTIFGHEWARVKGDFTGSWPNGNPLEPGQQDLINALAPVNISIERVFALRRDFTKVSGCRQGEKESVQDFRIRMEDCFRIHSGIPPSNAVDSPYVQQLKQSLMNGLHPGIADFIRKHNVNHRTCDLQECLNYAEHAATQIKEKRHKKASASAFFIGEDGEENQIFFVGPGQGRGGFNRGRGNDR